MKKFRFGSLTILTLAVIILTLIGVSVTNAAEAKKTNLNTGSKPSTSAILLPGCTGCLDVEAPVE